MVISDTHTVHVVISDTHTVHVVISDTHTVHVVISDTHTVHVVMQLSTGVSSTFVTLVSPWLKLVLELHHPNRSGGRRALCG